MDEKLDYNKGKRSEEDVMTNWQLGATSVLSCGSDASGVCCSSQDHQLRYIPQREFRSERPIIPSSRSERLAYFRSYVSTPSKTQIICMQHVHFNRFLWYYVFNVFFKSLPHTFVYIFFASYAPDEHFFMKKMVPICRGFTISYIIAAILDMTSQVFTITQLLDYALCGILFKNPWNRCSSKFHVDYWNETIRCYELDEFAKQFQNDTPVFNVLNYVSSNGQNFQMAPLIYYSIRSETLSWPTKYGSLRFVYFVIIWLIVVLHHKQLYKRYIWKVSHIVHIIVTGVYVLVFIHVSLDYFLTHLDNVPTILVNYDQIQKILWKADIDMLAESMTTPPVVHILTARSTQEIQPNRDSSVIITSNAIYYIFRGFLSYRVKKYCESLIKAQIYLTDFNQDSFFYFWPIYFSTFYLGDFYSIIFFFLHFLMEVYTLIVTYQCLVEAIVCEWRFTNSLLVTVILSAISGVWVFATDYDVRMLFYIYTKAMVTLIEIIGIYVIYPVGRLIDDITFYSGIIPTKMRKISLRMVPVFYAIKVYTMFDGLFEATMKFGANLIIDFIYVCLITLAIPVVVGALYSAYLNVWKKRKTWSSLFRPADDWGPAMYSERQLRKLYDSRKFVGSQAPRRLSRYMIKKENSKVYNLDVIDVCRRSTFVNYAEVRIENETKNS